MAIRVSRFIDVADGTTEGQFSVGQRDEIDSLESLDPLYRQLLDDPVTAVIAVVGPDGGPNMTPVWFGYLGDLVHLNLAAHRKKVAWIRKRPKLTYLLVNPTNPYHWVSLKTSVVNEIHEDDPEAGHKATETIDRAWTKYTSNEPPYGLRDPSRDERRILFECRVERMATFGRP